MILFSNRNRWLLFVCIGSLTCVLLLNCNGKGSGNTVSDSPHSGSINISVDETFKPVIEEEIKVYEASYPGTRIIAHYKPEAACFRDLLSDTSNRMIIVTRSLNPKEEQYLYDSLAYYPYNEPIASDAIAIIVNAKSPDSVFTLNELKKDLKGAKSKEHIFVFDGLSATGTVRFAMDSILKGEPFDTGVVKAVNSSREVLEYVASNKDAIGFVGISWIGNPEDSSQVNMLKKVKIAYVKCDLCPDSAYVKPSQLSILTKRYPLVRGLYYILKENFTGLGAGFAAFMKYERGQLIFRRAYLGPKMGFGIRSVNLNLNEKL